MLEGLWVGRMKVIVIRYDIVTHPMTQSIIRMLMDMEIPVTVITTYGKDYLENLFDKKVEVISIGIDYRKQCNILIKFLRMFRIKYRFWKEIDKRYTKETILWISHVTTIKHLGSKIEKYRYILHLNELNENILYWKKLPFIKINTKKLGNKAEAIVVPEYNRAHITKAYWELLHMPYILPNKPYLTTRIKKNEIISHSEQAKVLFEKIKGKFIILYQGTISKERKLEKFIEAVKILGNEYALVIMSERLDLIKGELPENCFLLDYVNPPYHLEITSHANLGVLSYTPVKNSNSLLNALYCAPNKIFEYGMFGIPMLSNDVPALKYIFDIWKCGKCVDKDDIISLISAIKEIRDNYMLFEDGAKKFYDSVDNIKIMKDIFCKITN